ncbi:MAG: hypothetical protein GC158_05395 [Cyanobacteria bacterium RI_101]|nr:hypothetical protein [Cyanobacteria bacterium RI_101]
MAKSLIRSSAVTVDSPNWKTKVSLPSLPARMSAPAPPLRILAPVLPVRRFFRPLPVPLRSALPARVRFSRLAPRV